MKNTGNRALPPLSAWGAQYIRMIAFTAEPALYKEQLWWKNVTGFDSDDYTTVSKKNAREESGSVANSKLSLGIDLHRITWTLEQKDNNPIDPSSDNPLNVGSFVQMCDTFEGLMLKWLEECPPMKRLAFASALLQLKPSKDDVHALLNSYLSAVTIDPGTGDFQYRINRPRPSKVMPDMTINRLMTWKATTMVVLSTSLPTLELDTPPKESLYCSVDLDVNTDQTNKKMLPKEKVKDVFSELVSLGKEIAEKGEIK